MEKNCLRQLEALLNSFTFYPERFFKKHSIKRYGQKYEFLSEIAYPLLDRKIKLRPNFFHGYLSWD